MLVGGMDYGYKGHRNFSLDLRASCRNLFKYTKQIYLDLKEENILRLVNLKELLTPKGEFCLIFFFYFRFCVQK